MSIRKEEHMKKWRIAAFLLAALVLAACGGTTSGGTGGKAEVVMKNTTFQPGEITVSAGTTVTWTNEDPTAHTVTSGTRDNPTGLFDSGNVGSGQSFSFTFDQPGTYNYFCRIHAGMKGTVIVE
jgi:plastocyanin